MSTLRGQASQRRRRWCLRTRIFRSWPRAGRQALLWSLTRRRELSLMRLNRGVRAMRPGWALRRASSTILATFELFAACAHLRGYFPGLCPSADGLGVKSDGQECPSHTGIAMPGFSTESGSFPQAEYVTDDLY